MRNLCLLIFSLGCALAVAHAEEPASDPVIDLSAMSDVTSLIDLVSDRDVVFIGERHDQYQHHLNQLSIIKGLHKKHPDLGIGLEYVFQPFQNVLDRYIKGAIDEAGLIRESEFISRWKFDFKLYRPIFQYARENGIPLIALNLENEITNKVKEGGIESLSDESKLRLPSYIDWKNEAYRKRLLRAFNSHPHTEEMIFENFLAVQLIWDEAMAQRAADWLKQNSGSHLVVLAGGGHIMHGDGIPNRLSRRINVSQATILNIDAVPGGVTKGLADYMILAGKRTLPPSGKLGVLFDTTNSAILIKEFVKDSSAKEAGAKKFDKLLSIDGQPVQNYTDIRIALMDRKVGERIELEIERNSLILGAVNKTLQVTLR